MNNHSSKSNSKRDANPAFPEPPSVTRQKDERTGRIFLQGLETADADRANVFGDADNKPSGRGLNTRPLLTEVEVRYRFFEGSVEDHSEVHSFWAREWSKTSKGAQAEVLINGEDFNAYHEEDWGEWAPLLRLAVQRIRDARYNRIEFEPRLVGAPKAR